MVIQDSGNHSMKSFYMKIMNENQFANEIIRSIPFLLQNSSEHGRANFSVFFIISKACRDIGTVTLICY